MRFKKKYKENIDKLLKTWLNEDIPDGKNEVFINKSNSDKPFELQLKFFLLQVLVNFINMFILPAFVAQFFISLALRAKFFCVGDNYKGPFK